MFKCYTRWSDRCWEDDYKRRIEMIGRQQLTGTAGIAEYIEKQKWRWTGHLIRTN